MDSPLGPTTGKRRLKSGTLFILSILMVIIMREEMRGRRQEEKVAITDLGVGAGVHRKLLSL